MLLKRSFSPWCLIADLHQLFLLTAVGGLIALLFSGTDLPAWLAVLDAMIFLLGVVIGSWEE